jgi:hypothetical protein
MNINDHTVYDPRCHKYENVANPSHYIHNKNNSTHDQLIPLFQTKYSALKSIITLLTN